MKKRRKFPYWANWVISIFLFSIIFVTFYGLINTVLFYDSERIVFSRVSMIYLMYLFAGVSFVSGYVIHGWVEVETTNIGNGEDKRFIMDKLDRKEVE